MPAKILIKRTFRAGITREIQSILDKLRAAARHQHGYITGETLQNPDRPREILVISSWSSIENWVKWKESDERKGLESLLEVHIEGGSRYETYVSL